MKGMYMCAEERRIYTLVREGRQMKGLLVTLWMSSKQGLSYVD